MPFVKSLVSFKVEVKLLKVIERHQILMLAWHKQISRRNSWELSLSLSHAKLFVRKHKEATVRQITQPLQGLLQSYLGSYFGARLNGLL